MNESPLSDGRLLKTVRERELEDVGRVSVFVLLVGSCIESWCLGEVFIEKYNLWVRACVYVSPVITAVVDEWMTGQTYN